MSNRFKDAILAQTACNPGALCASISRYQSEMYAQGMSTDDVRADPALRLIAYQIGWLFSTRETENEYNELIALCEAAH